MNPSNFYTRRILARCALGACALTASILTAPLHAAPTLTELNAKPHSVPKGVRLASVDWSISTLQIQQDNFIVAKVRNAAQVASAAPSVRFSAFKKFPTTQSPPNSKGDTTGSGGSMSAIIADVQPSGTSAGEVLNVQPYAIPKDYLECSEITAEVDFKRATADTSWSNNKVTIKTKCGATPATTYYSIIRPGQ
jgi:hypothetical protein